MSFGMHHAFVNDIISPHLSRQAANLLNLVGSLVLQTKGMWRECLNIMTLFSFLPFTSTPCFCFILTIPFSSIPPQLCLMLSHASLPFSICSRQRCAVMHSLAPKRSNTYKEKYRKRSAYLHYVHELSHIQVKCNILINSILHRNLLHLTWITASFFMCNCFIFVCSIN